MRFLRPLAHALLFVALAGCGGPSARPVPPTAPDELPTPAPPPVPTTRPEPPNSGPAPRFALRALTTCPRALVFSPDSTLLAAAGTTMDRLHRDVPTVALLDVASGAAKALLRTDGDIGMAWSAAFTPDGATLLVGGLDAGRDEPGAFLSEWDVTAAHRLLLRPGPEGTFTALGCSDDKMSLAALGRDGSVVRWNSPDGTAGYVLKPLGTATQPSALSGDGRRVARIESEAPVIRIRDTLTGQQVRDIGFRMRPGIALALNGDGTRLTALATAVDHIRVWNLTDGMEVAALPHRESLSAVALSADGRTLAVTGLGIGQEQWETYLRVWDVASGQLRLKVEGLPENFGHRAPTVGLSADGSRVALGSYERDHTGASSGVLRVWDVPGGG